MLALFTLFWFFIATLATTPDPLALNQNLYTILEHNTQANSTFRLKVNSFIYHDIKTYIGNLRPILLQLAETTKKDTATNGAQKYPTYIFEELDYRRLGIVSTPKDQGQCGSCWAFALTGALESIYALETGELVDLSAQHILDCAGGDNDCNGGQYHTALRLFENHNWLYKDGEYPYTGRVGRCTQQLVRLDIHYSGYRRILGGDDDMVRQLVRYGPLPIAIRVTEKFMFYDSGIFDDTVCLFGQPNHTMLLIGYTKNYWILKNSWGTHWGESGYMRVRRGESASHCGISDSAIVLLFHKN